MRSASAPAADFTASGEMMSGSSAASRSSRTLSHALSEENATRTAPMMATRPARHDVICMIDVGEGVS
jgi:hypothetical protein